MNTCGRADCSSPCHRPEVTPGVYCAPLRCYCQGCPSYAPYPEHMRLEARAHLINLHNRHGRPVADVIPEGELL